MLGSSNAPRDSVPITVAETKIVLSPNQAGAGRQAIPANRLGAIFSDTSALVQAVAKVISRLQITSGRSKTEPVRCSASVLGQSDTISESESQIVGSSRMPPFSCQPVPTHCFTTVSASTTTEIIASTEVELRSHVPLPGRSSPKGGSAPPVPTRGIASEGKSIAEPKLRVAVASEDDIIDAISSELGYSLDVLAGDAMLNGNVGSTHRIRFGRAQSAALANTETEFLIEDLVPIN